MKNILITGGTGLVGRHLARRLIEKNYNVSLLTRSPGKVKGYKAYKWDINEHFIDPDAITTANIIVHLAGENISSGRWTRVKKNKILTSRVEGSRLLYEYAQTYGSNLEAFISASAIGFYGTYTSKDILKETDPPGKDFLARIGAVWEEAAWNFANIGKRVSIARTGIVLAPDGGIVQRVYPLAKIGVLSPVGSGKQYFPWIHIDDLVEIYLWMIEGKINGVFNAVAPEFVTFRDFVKALMNGLGKKIIMPNVPAFALKLLFGQMSSIMLYGSRVSADKILCEGFKFKFTRIDQAIKDILTNI